MLDGIQEGVTMGTRIMTFYSSPIAFPSLYYLPDSGVTVTTIIITRADKGPRAFELKDLSCTVVYFPDVVLVEGGLHGARDLDIYIYIYIIYIYTEHLY